MNGVLCTYCGCDLKYGFCVTIIFNTIGPVVFMVFCSVLVHATTATYMYMDKKIVGIKNFNTALSVANSASI